MTERETVATDLPGWGVEGEHLVGSWLFDDFASAFAAATRIAFLAERTDHHPDLRVSWGRLEMRVTTHSAGRLTGKDVDLARAVEAAIGPPRG
ncbi:MAG: 4a-hydroxytetrahydrobiopterin dehydratase [Acidobacteriota bacterium]